MKKYIKTILVTLALLLVADAAWGQIYYSPARRVIKYGAEPATCTTGDLYYNSATDILYNCTATDTWTAVGYLSTARRLYGDDWATCEFGWSPALEINA
jgi:hypothetical protein